MLAAVFNFRGRINRSKYLLGSLAIAAIFVALAQLFIGFGSPPATPRSALAVTLDAVLLVMAAPLAAWVAISLQVRRLRDIGWNPLIAVPLWLGALAGMAVLGSPDAAQTQTAVGTLINFAALTCLLVWPGRRGGLASISDDGRLMALAPAASRSYRGMSAVFSSTTWR